MEADLRLMVSSKLTFLLGYEPFGKQLEAHRPKKNIGLNWIRIFFIHNICTCTLLLVDYFFNFD